MQQKNTECKYNTKQMNNEHMSTDRRRFARASQESLEEGGFRERQQKSATEGLLNRALQPRVSGGRRAGARSRVLQWGGTGLLHEAGRPRVPPPARRRHRRAPPPLLLPILNGYPSTTLSDLSHLSGLSSALVHQCCSTRFARVHLLLVPGLVAVPWQSHLIARVVLMLSLSVSRSSTPARRCTWIPIESRWAPIKDLFLEDRLSTFTKQR